MSNLHRVIFGSLVLSDGTTERPMDTDYWFSVMGENFSTGQPEPITTTIESFMLDGAMVLKDGDGNRQMTAFVGIHGPDTKALTDGEVALTLETGKRNSFIYEEFDGFGPPTLFEVVSSSFGQVPDDVREVMQCERVYALNIIALPQAFSTTITITPALISAATPVTATIADGTTATGWTSPYGTVTAGSGELALPAGGIGSLGVDSYGNEVYDATSEGTFTAAAVDYSATPYVVVDLRLGYTNQYWQSPSLGPAKGVTMLVDGVSVPLASTEFLGTVSGTSKYRLKFYVADTSATTLTLRVKSLAHTSPTFVTLVDNVSRTTIAPSLGTARQQARILDIGGSVRTPGTLMLSHASSALGDVLVHTAPPWGGQTPCVSQWSTNSGTTAAGNVSGKVRTASSHIFDVPTAMLRPGSYVLLMRAKSATASITVTYAAQSRIGSNSFGPIQSDRKLCDMNGPDNVLDYRIHTLGTLDLPVSSEPAAATASVQRITLGSDPLASYDIDEVWLFFMGDHLGNRGQLTQLSCGTATPAAGSDSSKVFIESASVDSPLPGVYVGTQADQSDARFAADALWDQHQFSPEGVAIFTVTTNALDAEASFRHREAGHSHAPS